MIVLPMAGLSSRFSKQGYNVPKYMLEIKGISVFEHVLDSFKNYFHDTNFLFIIRERGFGTEDFINKVAAKKQLSSYKIFSLQEDTAGQAETVYIALKKVVEKDSETLTIFNIDTFRPNFTYPEFLKQAQVSYLETFIGSGKNWSNVIPKNNSDDVSETSEKKEASQYCCTGLYHWATVKDFIDSFEFFEGNSDGEEKYIAPIYNYLIKNGVPVKFTVIDRNEVIFCGVPSEYEELKKMHFGI